jgi:hypothetical protein
MPFPLPGANRDFVPGKSHPPTHCCHDRRLAKDARARKPQRTESIAVSSGALLEAIAETIPLWQRLSGWKIGESAWVLREHYSQELSEAEQAGLEARIPG